MSDYNERDIQAAFWEVDKLRVENVGLRRDIKRLKFLSLFGVVGLVIFLASRAS